jgi:hypothetical protein
MAPEAARPFPDLLDQEEKKSLLTKAELLWRDLQNNDLGGYSGHNRPFWIVAEFKEVIEKYGKRDVGLTWSHNALEAARASTTSDPEVRGWQPMDTAPTNGDRVDIWLEPHDAEESGNAHRRTDAYFKDGNWWFRANDGSRDVSASYHWKVTAWMPIPGGPPVI